MRICAVHAFSPSSFAHLPLPFIPSRRCSPPPAASLLGPPPSNHNLIPRPHAPNTAAPSYSSEATARTARQRHRRSNPPPPSQAQDAQNWPILTTGPANTPLNQKWELSSLQKCSRGAARGGTGRLGGMLLPGSAGFRINLDRILFPPLPGY